MARVKPTRHLNRYTEIGSRRANGRVSRRKIMKPPPDPTLMAYRKAFKRANDQPFIRENNIDMEDSETQLWGEEDYNQVNGFGNNKYESDNTMVYYTTQEASASKDQKRTRINLDNREASSRLWEEVNPLLGFSILFQTAFSRQAGFRNLPGHMLFIVYLFGYITSDFQIFRNLGKQYTLTS
ncbi:uncharacterized protein K444DRAFT_638516 [Hyaloscypha bicolor E]|uniref:Uncharacterized protein n=1 Tax=Hyaloscypha bicolor E TaxID=1095630 RepID=A0A2J6SGP8_9HELO|nr:uncharacterized protein K444DRAFT_638516 [Hyaloscypha bicolor E]PMD49937.1 hypothetical protein K444DRAFT_638516 [Hyaloscypha bicolor E]